MPRLSFATVSMAASLALVLLAAAGLVAAELGVLGPAGEEGGTVRLFLSAALACALIAIVVQVIVGRALIRSVEALTRSAERIGRGDLATPVGPATLGAGAEASGLARSLEEMRGRLLERSEELRTRQADAEGVLLGIAEGVYSVDRERRVRYLNPQAAALLGVSAERAPGMFCGDLLRPQGPDGVRPCEDRCPILHARFRGSARATETLRLADGRTRTVVITSAMPSVDVGAGAGAERAGRTQFQVIRDETEIEATRRSRDAILANISHEFRTPLSAQLASIELLRDRLGELSVEESRELVLSLERGALRLTQLIDNLLESVRIEAGRVSVRLQPVALDEIVEEAVEMTSPLVVQRGQRLQVDLPFPVPAVKGDTPRLVQVFVNLLANANKFSPQGSTIRIGGAVYSREVRLWVEDEGPGLPAGDEASIFERFERALGQEPEQSGLGLGLWIVKSIVERHGGRVEAVSGQGATGTRMCIVLPVGSAP